MDTKTLYSLIGASLSAIDQLRRVQADLLMLRQQTEAILAESFAELDMLHVEQETPRTLRSERTR